MAKQDEYQATADSVSRKLSKLYESLNGRERAVLSGLLGQAAATNETKSRERVPDNLAKHFEVRREPLVVRVGENKLQLHYINLAW